MVEHGVAGEEGDDGGVGGGIVAETYFFDPSEEGESVDGAAGAVDDPEDEGLVEVGDDGADGVLEAGGPRALGHHVADRFVEGDGGTAFGTGAVATSGGEWI